MEIERNHIFDALKFICAFMVITIHVHSYYREIAKPFVRCAVPLFFMISGYFLYTNDNFGGRLLKSIKKVTRIFLSMLVLFSILFPILLKCGIEQPLKLYDLPIFVLTNEVPIAYHLWYLPAFIYVLSITYFADKWDKLKILFPLSLVIICIYLVGTYSLMLLFKYRVPSPVLRNFIFVGFPFFCLGMYLKQHEVNCKNISDRLIYSLGILAILISFIEWKLTSYYGVYFPYYLGTLLLTTAIFLYCMNHSLKTQNLIAKLGCEYSLYIYLLHPIVRYPFSYYEKFASSNAISLYLYTSPVLITLLTIGLIYFLKKVLRIKL